MTSESKQYGWTHSLPDVDTGPTITIKDIPDTPHQGATDTIIETLITMGVISPGVLNNDAKDSHTRDAR